MIFRLQAVKPVFRNCLDTEPRSEQCARYGTVRVRIAACTDYCFHPFLKRFG